MNLHSFVEGNELKISEIDWSNIKKTYEKEEIKLAISDVIKDLPLPYAVISYDEVVQDFLNLKHLDSFTLGKQGDWFSRYDYDRPFSQNIIGTSRIGNNCSNYFHQVNRWKCNSINSPSPERTWDTEKFRLTLLNGLWTQKAKRIDNSVLRSCIALRKYIASQFRPSSAKFVYETFQAKKVLDFSSGWGDRLAGFYGSSQTEYYLGVDPNTNLMMDYYDQMYCYEQFAKNNKQAEIINSPFEDVTNLKDDYFDLVFTSPPYFRVERYTEEDTQSWKRYKKLDVWLEKFLFDSLEKAWQALKSGGHLVVNISDVYMNHTINQICDPMNNFIENKLKGTNFRTIGYQMAKRPNSKSDKTGIFCEPVWVWRKP